ncbi:MAG: OadG family protein [Lentisphaeria bacterium]|nr:OadG family protein [Lentisphaeria bacterium]
MGQMLMDGVKAVVLGMGMVYVFLIIMIILMTIMSKLLAPYANFLVKQQPVKKAAAKKADGGKTLSAEDKILAKAAIEAVKMHRGA